jgi:hypothetical protein
MDEPSRVQPEREDRPVTVFMHGRQVMAHPVFDEELRNLQSATVWGGICLAATGFFFGAYINYKIALQTSGLTLDVQTKSDYRTYVWGAKYLAFGFGIAAVWSLFKVATQIRRIKKGESIFVWSDPENKFVLAGDVHREFSLWFKLKRKIHSRFDSWVS